ncbi:exodeoxyribonuclease VII small subunit [Planococcus sp. CP5-4]|uniref:Exodeoxyribonuclease 7 small subunit n=2 Tax=Planococcus TaxID=1372 RepID=A0A0U2Q6E3_9BACL|nr:MULTISPECIES: exodeoxyribonuclease VII small subunit [Planococcus]MDN5708002.1 exodeoxyribonuclease VII small subunit [Planococcus sp. (in: firmicutes)]ALS74166.1 exodeoxyribonuclease VII small subunit [Planococcus rifietoensis]AUD13795.1 exodeoxyribonuclease VII small subunit [Planococcus sp. MB-3u-03]MBU9672753.1 exodeoxyribonuclease VII small subunit [Planococcus sp. CP5-4_YE]MBV0908525.1 exodeoxyribonuclease VII small subunit [Planococcus sp. CP5-4_UN]
MAENNMMFNDAMEQLEEIVKLLEQGDVPLEEALTLYQKGMELSKLCHDKLKNAETQLVTMMKDGKEVPAEIEGEGNAQ